MQHKLFSFSILFLILLNFKHTAAENKLILCNEYDADGNYNGDFKNWTIQKGGNFMYILYKPTVPLNDSVFISIYKTFNRKDTNYNEYDHYYLVPDASKKWAVNKYTFTKTGRYKIMVFNRAGKQLAEPVITDIALNPNEYNDMYFADTWYYNNCSMEFYESVSGDSMIGKNNVFAYRPEGNKVTLYIKQEDKRPLKTSHLFANIYTEDKCRELVYSTTYYVDKDWHWTFVSVYFDKKGKYSVELYNDDDVFINRALLEIK